MTRTFRNFLLVGGIAAAVNWASRFGFEHFMNLSWSVVAAYVVGMITAYILSRLFVFEPSGRTVGDEGSRFIIVNLFAIGIVWAITLGLARFVFPLVGFEWHAEAVAHGIGVMSPAVTSYFGHRHFTFSKPPVETQSDLAPFSSHETPLAVDMDGTLLLTDVLLEGLVAGLSRQPGRVVGALPLLLRSRAAFKARIAEIAPLDPLRLPVRESLLDHLRREKERGRTIHLVTAGQLSVAQGVAARFAVFDSVHGSTGELNLKGSHKLRRLHELFPGGFAYAGDSAADLKVWSGAQSIILAGADPFVANRARKTGKPLEAEFDAGGTNLRSWRKALRLHQWLKNGLILVPLALSGNLTNLRAIAIALAGFLLMGIVASATYLVNDLADLEADRQHRTKRSRPLASGGLPLAQALIAIPIMLIIALVCSFLLAPPFSLVLLVYLVLTLFYTFKLKRIPLLDVMTLGGLYTLRLVAGTVLAEVPFSPWLLTFSLFFFFSMSLAKRHVEVSSTDWPSDMLLPGRGYKPTDAPLTLAMGIATSAAAILVIVEYMMAEAFPSNVYAFPSALWAAPLLLGLWICRIWLLAHRGELKDDPVAFAVKDQISIILALALGVAFLLAWL